MCVWGGVSFLKGVASGRLTVMGWVAPHPGVIRQHKLKSAGYKNTKQGHRVGGVRRWGWIWEELGEGIRGEYDQHALFEILT